VDINKIIKNREARNSRNNRPISAFVELYQATDKAFKEVVDLGASIETQETLIKSHVINIVTAIEVYYRDMLDSVFKCVNLVHLKRSLKNYTTEHIKLMI